MIDSISTYGSGDPPDFMCFWTWQELCRRAATPSVPSCEVVLYTRTTAVNGGGRIPGRHTKPIYCKSSSSESLHTKYRLHITRKYTWICERPTPPFGCTIKLALVISRPWHQVQHNTTLSYCCPPAGCTHTIELALCPNFCSKVA